MHVPAVYASTGKLAKSRSRLAVLANHWRNAPAASQPLQSGLSCEESNDFASFASRRRQQQLARRLRREPDLTRTMCNSRADLSGGGATAAPSLPEEGNGFPATSSRLSSLVHILNARDLAEATPKIKAGRLFRSGSPAQASREDVLLLRRNLHVQQMIDFRSSEEHREDKTWSLMLSNGVMKTYNADGDIVQVSVDDHSDLEGQQLLSMQLHRLSLMERNRMVRGIIAKLPTRKLLWAALCKLTGYEAGLRDTLIPELNRGGLLMIYQILLDTAQKDLARSLQIVAQAAEQRQPCLFFCKLGKDRTGLMAALVLSACGASDDEIVADYVRSDGVHQMALGGLEKQQELRGLDSRVFEAAPEEAMRQLLQYAGERWGGLRMYMEHIGFDRMQQARLRRALSEPGGWPEPDV